MDTTILQVDEQSGLAQALRATRESLMHLAFRPRCPRTITQAVQAVEHLGEQATWLDLGPMTRLAERMASVLRGAALDRHGIAADDLAAIRRLFRDAITQQACAA